MTESLQRIAVPNEAETSIPGVPSDWHAPPPPARLRSVPASPAPAPIPVPLTSTDVDRRPEPAGFDDVPTAVWRLFLLSWLGFLAVLWAGFGGAAESAFAVAVATFFAAMYFATPCVVLRFVRNPPAQPPDRPRVRRHVGTLTGELPIASAAAQILVLPVALTLGMAVIVLVVR